MCYCLILGDHALIDINKLLSLNPKQVTVRTKSRDNQSSDSLPTPIPPNMLKGKQHSNKVSFTPVPIDLTLEYLRFLFLQLVPIFLVPLHTSRVDNLHGFLKSDSQNQQSYRCLRMVTLDYLPYTFWSVFDNFVLTLY